MKRSGGGEGLSWDSLFYLTLFMGLIGFFIFVLFKPSAAKDDIQVRSFPTSALAGRLMPAADGTFRDGRSVLASPTPRPTLTLRPTNTMMPLNHDPAWQASQTAIYLETPRARATDLALTVQAQITVYPSSTPLPLRPTWTATIPVSGFCVRVTNRSGDLVYVNVLTGEFC